MKKAIILLLAVSIAFLGCVSQLPEKNMKEYFDASITKNYSYTISLKEYYKGKEVISFEGVYKKYGNLIEIRGGDIRSGAYTLYNKNFGGECYLSNLSSKLTCALVTNVSEEYIRGIIFDKKILNLNSTPAFSKIINGKYADCYDVKGENVKLDTIKLLTGGNLKVKKIEGTICYYRDLEFPAYMNLKITLQNEVTLKTEEFDLKVYYKVLSEKTTLNDISPPSGAKIAYNPYLTECKDNKIIVPIFQMSKEPLNVTIYTYYTEPFNVTLNNFAEIKNVVINIPEENLNNYTNDLHYYTEMGYILAGDNSYVIECLI